MLVSESVSDEHAKRKSGRSGGSGLFPAIKTALVDVCHRKKVNADTILKGCGELGLGRPRKDGFHSDFEISSKTEFNLLATRFGRPRPRG